MLLVDYLVQLAADCERYSLPFQSYLAFLDSEVGYWNQAAALEVDEGYIRDKLRGGIPFPLVSRLVVDKNYSLLSELLYSLARAHHVQPREAERVRQMLKLK